MVRVKILMVSVFCFSLLSILPVKTAHTDEIPFFIERDTTAPYFLYRCDGPFFRTSGCRPYPDATPSGPFYSAEDNVFTPFGPWTCSVFVKAQNCFESNVKKVDFCLDRRVPQTPVIITVKGSSPDVTSNYPKEHPTCQLLSTSALLGDGPKESRADRDTFSFEDTEGDELTLRLEEDGSVGHIGEEADFRLRGPIGSASLDESRTGKLPLEITATIPKSGEYEIVVDQKNIRRELRFRGGYIITLDSSLGDVDEIVPSKNVEE